MQFAPADSGEAATSTCQPKVMAQHGPRVFLSSCQPANAAVALLLKTFFFPCFKRERLQLNLCVSVQNSVSIAESQHAKLD